MPRANGSSAELALNAARHNAVVRRRPTGSRYSGNHPHAKKAFTAKRHSFRGDCGAKLVGRSLGVRKCVIATHALHLDFAVLGQREGVAKVGGPVNGTLRAGIDSSLCVHPVAASVGVGLAQGFSGGLVGVVCSVDTRLHRTDRGAGGDATAQHGDVHKICAPGRSGYE